MSERRPAPSRSNLLELARRLERVRRGASLLRRKREALVTELFRIARPALEARREIGEQAQRAYEALLAALALRGAPELEALGLPERPVHVEVGTRSVWGVQVTTLEGRPPLVRSPAVRGVAEASAGPVIDTTATAFERLVERLLDEAPRELMLEQLGEQLARTTRQVNVLEQRLGPQLADQGARIRRVLEEREREDKLRLRHLARRRR